MPQPPVLPVKQIGLAKVDEKIGSTLWNMCGVLFLPLGREEHSKVWVGFGCKQVNGGFGTRLNRP
jgi:hypothetical protein